MINPVGVSTMKYTIAINTGVVTFEIASAIAIQARYTGPRRPGS